MEIFRSEVKVQVNLTRPRGLCIMKRISEIQPESLCSLESYLDLLSYIYMSSDEALVLLKLSPPSE